MRNILDETEKNEWKIVIALLPVALIVFVVDRQAIGIFVELNDLLQANVWNVGRLLLVMMAVIKLIYFLYAGDKGQMYN